MTAGPRQTIGITARPYAIAATLRSGERPLLIRIAVARVIGDTAPMQMSASRLGLFLLVALATALPSLGRSVQADSVSRGAAIKQVVYLYNVTEYCGLNTREVYDGYRREIRDLTRE